MDRITCLLLLLTVHYLAGCQSPESQELDHIQSEFAQMPESVKPWANWYWMALNVLSPDDPLQPSGLLGPLTLEAQRK